MAYQNLSDWVDTLEKQGELKHVSAAVDWDQELGGITRQMLNMKENGTALLFDNIKDYEKTDCTRMLTNSLATFKRIALMLGLPKDTPVKELIQTVRERGKKPVKPVVVEHGPCKDNIDLNENVNILKFPVPKWHALDGGRYINTFGGVVTKDPKTGWTNVGIYRGMVVNNNTIAWALIAGKHWGRHYHEYRALGRPMPVAVVYGYHPVLPFAACASYPSGISEYDMMGALRTEPVELVKCETVDLLVPAQAEIVLEGLMPVEPESYQMEGPFGEFTGYYAGGARTRPVTRINCVTYRNNPIYQGTLEGRPPTEDAICSSVALSVVVWEALERMGIPGITDVFCPPCVASATDVRVQINKRYQGHAKQVAACIWAATPTFFKNVTVVEEDIDIYDPDAMEWAIAYRVDPKEDIVVFPGCPGSPLDPSSNPDLQDPVIFGAGRWNRCLIDATRTWRWGPRPEWGGAKFAPKVEVSPEIKEQVKRRWKEYGL